MNSSKPKYAIVCGPRLVMHNPQVLTAIQQAVEFTETKVQVIMLPEQNMGAPDIRSLVQSFVKQKTGVVIVTRYEHAVAELVSCITDKRIKPERVKLYLALHKRNDMTKFDVTAHQPDFDLPTIAYSWPMGALW